MEPLSTRFDTNPTLKLALFEFLSFGLKMLWDSLTMLLMMLLAGCWGCFLYVGRLFRGCFCRVNDGGFTRLCSAFHLSTMASIVAALTRYAFDGVHNKLINNNADQSACLSPRKQPFTSCRMFP